MNRKLDFFQIPLVMPTKKKKKPISNRTKILIAAGVLASGALIYIAIPKGGSPDQEKSASSFVSTAPKDFHGIPPEGTGGDPLLNKQKNRWSAPPEISIMTIAQIIDLPHDELSKQGAKDRIRWSSAATALAVTTESKGVQIEGYLAKVKESDTETANGRSEVYHDFHLWITESPDQNKNKSIIVEAIPYWKEYFPQWQLHTFQKIVTAHSKVRVTGWIFWDQEHGSEVGKSRGSLWEIHPFTKFEVFSGGQWQELTPSISLN